MSLRGINYRNTAEIAMEPIDILRAGDFQSVVLMSSSPSHLPRFVRAYFPHMYIIGRLFRGGPDLPTPEDAVSDWREYILGNLGVVDLWQVDNEPDILYPNVTPEDFCKWWINVVVLLDDEFPGQLWGFPMPSVQGAPSWDYAVRCEAGIQAADWLGERGYWTETWQMDDMYWGSRYHLTHERWPSKPIHICEYGNANPAVDPLEKARQYNIFVRELPPYVSSAHAFIMSNYLVNPS